MKSYLDEHLLTQLSMDDIRFRFLKGFPKTTIEISNVVLSPERTLTAGISPDPIPIRCCMQKTFICNSICLKCIAENMNLRELKFPKEP